MTQSDIWFSGSLLSGNATTAPKQHVLFQLPITRYTGNSIYNSDWQSIQSTQFARVTYVPQFYYGVMDNMDCGFFPGYETNQLEKTKGQGMMDSQLFVGLQLARQTPKNHLPDVRMTLGEILPSGRYDHLNPAADLTNATGMGSYQTVLSLHGGYLQSIVFPVALNHHLTFYYFIPSSVLINGLSSYGGNRLTHGKIFPGNSFGIDYAVEVSVSKRWAGVFEVLYNYNGASTFHGRFNLSEYGLLNSGHINYFPSQNIRNNLHLPSPVGNSTGVELVILPGVEFNFTANYGLLFTPLFTVDGKNVPKWDGLAAMITINI